MNYQMIKTGHMNGKANVHQSRMANGNGNMRCQIFSKI